MHSELNLKLRQYQYDAIDAVCGVSDCASGRKLLKIGCGLGKTLIAAHILKRLNPKCIMCIAPLRLSVQQLMHRIRPFMPGHAHILVDTEGTTDQDEIRRELDQNECTIVYSTFKSAKEIMAHLCAKDTYLVIDEVHNALNMGGFLNAFENALFMSATVPEEIFDVVNNLELVFSYGMAEGIKNGYICDYEVFLPYIVVDCNIVASQSPELEIHAKYHKEKIDFLITGLLQSGSKRCIVYLKNCCECEPFMNLFQIVMREQHGKAAWCGRIDSTVKCNTRDALLETFQNDDTYDVYIIASVCILDEAIDIPKCDSEFITFVGDSNSDIRTIQRLQRGGRIDILNPLKKNHMYIWADDWSQTIAALTLLKEEDMAFSKKIRVVKFASIQTKADVNLFDEDKKTEEFLKYIEMKCHSISQRWQIHYTLLAEYVGKFNTLPLKTTVYDGFNIGNWCRMQKQRHRCDHLNAKMITALENIHGWVWSRSPESDSWDTNYNVLQQYIENFNKIPVFQEVYNGTQIGRWCFYQRQNYLNGGTLLKNKDRVAKLEAITEWWWTERPVQKRTPWDVSFTLFQSCVAKHGKIPSRLEDNGMNMWAKYQRQTFHKGTLALDKQNKLESVKGWYWDVSHWQQGFDNLETFVIMFGRIPTATEKDENGYNIGSWCTSQRSNNRDGKWSDDDDRKKKLESLELWTWGTAKKTTRSTWDDNYAFLQEFTNLYKRLPKQTESYKDNKLGSWITQQRTMFKKEKMLVDRKTQLENIKVWTWVSKH